MDEEFDFDEQCIVLHYESDNVPQIHCPKSKSAIFPEITAEGMFVNGNPHPSDTSINYAVIPSVMFHVQSGVDGAFDYFRKDVKSAISRTRNVLRKEFRESDTGFDEEIFKAEYDNFQILRNHPIRIPCQCVIFHIIIDGIEDCSTYIGLDMS